MTSQIAAYTPLESLLLFQALRNGGIDPGSFARISEELKNVNLVRDDPTYDASRLSPDALRQLYLDLLKEEARADIEHLANGDTTSSRKRKAPSPKLPTVHEAAQHTHLIPQLITRLYTRYREISIGRIRGQETRFDELARDITNIKSGSVDHLLQNGNAPVDSKVPPSGLIDAKRSTVSNTIQNIGNGRPQVKDEGPLTPAKAILQGQPSTANVHVSSTHPHLQAAGRLQPAVSPRPIQAAQGAPVTPAQAGYVHHSQLQPAIAAQQHQYAKVRPQQPLSTNAGSAAVYTPQSMPTGGHYGAQMNNARHVQPQIMPAQAQGVTAPSTVPRPQPVQQVSMADVLRALATPPRQSRQPVWKTEDVPQIEAPGSPKRPQVELLSPILARAPSPVRRQQSGRGRQHKHEDDSEAGSARHVRSTSAESSIAESTHNTRRRVKHESSTPFIADSEEPELVPTQGINTRKRRGTLQQTQSSTMLRRRTQQADDDDPPPRSNTVLATRNFAKMSSVIMNEIVSHKHGSRFAQPVRDKDADGYSTFIKRPQDLKSIRAAITHGARAIVAATTSVAESPSAPPTPGGSKTQENVVELERTVDLIPPKAIVNGAQLEKEIMRMFANAVMFNPGEDGMVADTREMFEDVQAKIADWRGAERDLGDVAEEEEESRVKRRKL